MHLLSLFSDRYLVQLNMFVLCSPLPAKGNRRSISPHLRIAEEQSCGVITWASFFHDVGDKSKQGCCTPLSHRYVGWCFLHVTGLQSLSWGLTAVHSSHICLAVVFLALGPDYYGERWDAGLWLGCVLWWGCVRSPRWWVNECSPWLVPPPSPSGAPTRAAGRATAGCGTLWEPRPPCSTKNWWREEKVKAAMKIPFHICFSSANTLWVQIDEY